MRVGIDAQMLCRPVTGIERYAMEIIRRMLCMYPDVEFFLYAPLSINNQFNSSPNLTIRAANFKFGSVGRLFWAQTILPFWANKDELDVYWGPAHRIPHLLSHKIARVVTIHDLVWKFAGETMRPLNRVIERVLMPDAVRLADRVVADSQSTAEAIVIEFPLAKMKTQVIYLGATELPPPSASDVLLELGIDRSYMLFVGTLEPRKNLRRLLQAYATLDSSIQAKYLLVIAGGKGWGNQDMVTLIRELRIENSVRLTGYVNDEMLATLYQYALFLAMPSLYEGFGLPLLEAMSFGVPVLTSSCSSMPEVAGDAGFLVEPLNIDSIAQGVAKLLTDERYRNSLAVRAKSNAARFGWEKAAKEIMEVFKQAVLVRQAGGGLNEKSH